MSAADAVMWALDRNWEMIEAALQGLDDAVLTRRPAPHSNSIAWTMWHLSRGIDTFINTRLQGKTASWGSDGWYRQFGMKEDVRGMGWTEADLDAWTPPPMQAQLAYYEAMKTDARRYISSLSAADLDRRVTFPPEAQTQDHTLATALGQLVFENVAHGGQIAYLRGFFQGMGWHR
ncbi:MAG: DinB family protein [Dehalococcoidia bacterium]